MEEFAEGSGNLVAFQNYLISEYKVQDFAAVEFKYNHSENIKLDKKLEKYVVQHVILVGIKFYDKTLKLLHSANLKFVNNVLAKVCEKKLVNIAPAELNNKFMAARSDIIKTITDELIAKLNEVGTKLKSVESYSGKANANISISDQFKGELSQVLDSPVNVVSKNTFDM